jgi:tetratricopeptide (TPR) repeat protein
MDIFRPAGSLEFAHPIVREAVRADIGPRELANDHARGARVLASRGATDERIAAQIVEAAPAGDAERVELLRGVAEDAITRGAPAAAVAWLGRALAEPPPDASRAAVLVELGSSELRLGARDAVTHLTEAVALSQDPEELATAARRLAIALTLAGDAEQAVTALERAVDVVEPEHRELALLLEGEIWTHALQAGLETRARAVRRLERHAGRLEGSTPGERLVLASLACTRAQVSETAHAAIEQLQLVLADGRFVADQRAGLAGLGLSFDIALVLLVAEAFDLADSYIEQTLVSARAQAAMPSVAYLTQRRGWIALRCGAVAQAEAHALTALELLTSHQITLGIPAALAVLVESLIEGGELEAAERALQAHWSDPSIPPGTSSNFLLEARGLLHVAQGRTREGLEDLLEFGRRDEMWGVAHPVASRWRAHAALARAAIGDRSGARRMAHDDLERARRWGAASGIGIALRAVALTDDGADTVALLRDAIGVLEESPARLEHALPLPTSARPCAAPTVGRRRAPRSTKHLTSPRAPTPAPSSSGLTQSSAPPAADRADRRAAGSPR